MEHNQPGFGSSEDSDVMDEIKEPKNFKVILLNDDYTPMEFVILVLIKYFKMTQEKATQVMMDVHQKGAGVAGVYSYEVAEMKATQVNGFAKMNKHPLKTVIEEDE